jgi:hypothetical protein
LLRKKKVRNLHNSEFILRINSSETNPKSAEFAELFCVCVCVWCLACFSSAADSSSSSSSRRRRRRRSGC